MVKETPTKDSIEKFWKGILGEKKACNMSESWLGNLEKGNEKETEQEWENITVPELKAASTSLSNSNHLTSAKKCRRESCIIDFMLAKTELGSLIFKKMYFSKYSIKYVVKILPPLKNLYDHRDMFLKG